MTTYQPTNSSVLEGLRVFFEAREGLGALDEIGDGDLIEQGWVDSLDLVELAGVIGGLTRKEVDLTREDHFLAIRTIRGILEFFGSE